jgi:hypothetical protein
MNRGTTGYPSANLYGSPYFLSGQSDRTIDPMQTYLVETYLTRTHVADLRASVVRLSTTSREPPERGGARYVRSMYVPEDEVCFHVFEATSVEAVRAAGESVSLTFDRIVLAEEMA